MAISPKMLFVIVMALGALLYLRHESNHDKSNQQLLKRTMDKPIEQIERELNPTFVQMVNDGNHTKEQP